MRLGGNQNHTSTGNAAAESVGEGLSPQQRHLPCEVDTESYNASLVSAAHALHFACVCE
jgi:hypothetical protein